MKIVFLSYTRTKAFNHPREWLKRIQGYTGVLSELARRHTVISIEQINYAGIYSENGVEYHFLDFVKHELNVPWRLHHYVKKLEPDVVIVHGLIFPLQVIQLGFMLKDKTRIIVQHHAEKPGHGFLKSLQKRADAFIDAYFFASREMGNDWVDQGIIANGDKIKEVMEASSFFVPANKMAARMHTGIEGNPVFLWVGRLDDNKDPLTVIRGFLKFAGTHLDARLYMIFHHEQLLPQVQTLISNVQIGSHAVILAGRKEHAEMAHWYNAADYIVSGSHYEGMGVAVCEAMSCGCIPILTAIPSFRNVTGHGSCGITYDAGNESSLTDALIDITERNRDIERQKVIQQFDRHISFSAIARDIDAVLASLLSTVNASKT